MLSKRIYKIPLDANTSVKQRSETACFAQSDLAFAWRCCRQDVFHFLLPNDHFLFAGKRRQASSCFSRAATKLIRLFSGPGEFFPPPVVILMNSGSSLIASRQDFILAIATSSAGSTWRPTVIASK